MIRARVCHLALSRWGSLSSVRQPALRARAMMKGSAVEYCRTLLRRVDHESYLVGLLLPGPVQRHCHFAVRALNAELAAVVSDAGERKEPALARLIWWRDSLISMYKHKGQAPAHPVLQALHAPVASGILSRSFVLRLVEVREEEISRHSLSFRTVADMEQVRVIVRECYCMCVLVCVGLLTHIVAPPVWRTFVWHAQLLVARGCRGAIGGC